MMILFNECCVSCKLQHHQSISQSSWILSWNFSACTFGWRQKHSHRGSIQKLVKVASYKEGAHAKFSKQFFSPPWVHHFPYSFFLQLFDADDFSCHMLQCDFERKLKTTSSFKNGNSLLISLKKKYYSTNHKNLSGVFNGKPYQTHIKQIDFAWTMQHTTMHPYLHVFKWFNNVQNV